MSQLLQVGCRSGVLKVIEGIAPPTHFHNGIPYEGDAVAVSFSLPITHYHQGLPFNSLGRIAALTGPPDSIQSGPIPIKTTGRVSGSLDLTPSNYNGGVPYGADGGLVFN